MNQAQYDSIKTEAFVDELQKIAGPASEIAGTVLWAPMPSAIGGLVGAASGGYNKAEYAKAMKRGASNVLIPGVGPYRITRRVMTDEKIRKDYEKSKKD